MDEPFSPALKQKIEAILYLKAISLNIAMIAEYADCESQIAEDGIIDLMNDYAHRDSALEIVQTNEGFSLRLRPEFTELVQKLIPANLGKGALKTLAAIALKPKISQSELVELRGSSAYQQIQELVEQGFIKKRRQAEGRSFWLQVTGKFHQYFETPDSPLKLKVSELTNRIMEDEIMEDDEVFDND
jgi:segregation and condensation protein B